MGKNNKYFGAPIRPKGQDTVEAFREWGKDELKSGVQRTYDLGKFLFSISAATLGLIAGLARLSGISFTNCLFIAALLVLFCSVGVAIRMVVPKLWVLDGNTNLTSEYNAIIDSSQNSLLLWTLFWGGGVVCFFLALFS